jgi:hypothetical protein
MSEHHHQECCQAMRVPARSHFSHGQPGNYRSPIARMIAISLLCSKMLVHMLAIRLFTRGQVNAQQATEAIT